jgi:hypothetical protein
MRKILVVVFLISLILALTSCNFIRQKLHFGKYSLEEALEWAKQDSIRNIDSLKRVMADTKVITRTLTDSLTIIEDNNQTAGDSAPRFYIISGSFSNHDNAVQSAQRYISQGFKTTIINADGDKGSGLEYVSVKIFVNFNEAQSFLKDFKGSYDPEAWIYTMK